VLHGTLLLHCSAKKASCRRGSVCCYIILGTEKRRRQLQTVSGRVLPATEESIWCFRRSSIERCLYDISHQLPSCWGRWKAQDNRDKLLGIGSTTSWRGGAMTITEDKDKRRTFVTSPYGPCWPPDHRRKRRISYQLSSYKRRPIHTKISTASAVAYWYGQWRRQSVIEMNCWRRSGFKIAASFKPSARWRHDLLC